MARLPFALQLYSIREALQDDPRAALARVKEIGYDHVELAGTAGLNEDAFKKLLEDNGLSAVSAHVPFESCRGDLDAAVAGCVSLGVSWAVIPWLSGEENKTAADWTARAKEMEAFGRAFREAGIPLCYHNHTDEFRPEDGKTHFDAIFEAAAPDLLSVELDVGWAHYAGADPVALIKAYANRTPLLHIKDVKARVEGEAPVTTELGNGATRFEPVFEAAGVSGVSWLIVEQDNSARDPLESARMNAAYMRAHLS